MEEAEWQNALIEAGLRAERRGVRRGPGVGPGGEGPDERAELRALARGPAPRRRGDAVGAHPAVRLQVGQNPIVTSQYGSTALYQVSYQIQ